MNKVLYVKSEAGAWCVLDLFEGDMPAVTFKIDDLQQLQDRQASFSQMIKLPKSANNKRALGYAGDALIMSGTPYKEIPCRFYVDGMELVGAGFKLVIVSVSDTYNCQIISSSKGLFERLAGLELKGLELESVKWEVKAMENTNSDEDSNYVRFANYIPTMRGDAGDSVQQRQNDMPRFGGAYIAGLLHPFVRLERLVYEIFKQQGYSISLAPFDKDYYVLTMSLILDNPIRDSSKEPVFLGYAYGDVSRVIVPKERIYILPLGSGWHGSDVQAVSHYEMFALDDENASGNKPKGIIFCSPDDGKVVIRFKATSKYGGEAIWAGCRVYRFGYKNGLELSSIYEQGIAKGSGELETDEIEVQMGEVLYIDMFFASDTHQTANVTGRVDILPVIDGKARVGDYIDVASSVSIDSQLDVVKLFTQVFGLYAVVNEDTKVVEFFNLQLLVDNIKAGNIVNWSSKLHNGGDLDMTFAMADYGRKNLIKFKRNDTTKLEDAGVLRSNNQNIIGEKTLFTMECNTEGSKRTLLYGDKGFIDAGYPAMCDHIELSDKDMNYVDFKEGYYHAKRKSIKQSLYRVYKVRTGGVTPVNNSMQLSKYANRYLRNWWCAKYVSPAEMTEDYYNTMQEYILNDTLVMECEFRLTPLDMAMLDIRQPVYLSQFGAYFYISEVENYKAGELTKVKLIRLNIIPREPEVETD